MFNRPKILQYLTKDSGQTGMLGHERSFAVWLLCGKGAVERENLLMWRLKNRRGKYGACGTTAFFTALLMLATGFSRAGELAAEEIVGATNIHGGLCVHVGCGDGTLSFSLMRKNQFVVQGLDTVAANVEKAKQAAAQRKVSGQVTFELWSGDSLPYAHNLVSLLVVEQPGKIAQAEMLRVLRPKGVAYVKTAAGWSVLRKPWPAGMAGWSHPRQGPDGNAVSTDATLTLPKRIQWISGKSGKAFLAGDGMNYFGDVEAHDAFNGLPVWKQNMKPLVAADERLYGLAGGRLTALESASGKELKTYPEAGSPQSLLYVSKGVAGKPTLFAVGGDGVKALDAESGSLLWAAAVANPRSVFAGDGGIYCLVGKSATVLGLDWTNGKELWKKEYDWTPQVEECFYRRETAVFAVGGRGGAAPYVLSAKDGSLLWRNAEKKGFISAVADLLWIQPGGKERRETTGYDLKTGAQKRSFSVGYGHCHVPMATEKYFIDGELDFTDALTGKREANPIAKAACGKSFQAANGMLYNFPTGCVCFPMLKSYMALAPDEVAAPHALSVKPSLERGPAFGKTPARGAGKNENEEWPTYRRDAWRSSCTAAAAPPTLQPLWSVAADNGASASAWKEMWTAPYLDDSSITPPTVAEGLVFVAAAESHQVVAFDARTGQERWRHYANGRIDTPPTVTEGLCLFGTHAGWIYCLTAADGQLVWRLRIGPEDRRIMAHGQLESAWPAPGAVLVDRGVVYTAAGRHFLADGGIFVYALDPRSGSVRWTSRVDQNHTAMPPNRWYGRLGNDFDPYDLLAKDGEHLALSRWTIDAASGKVTADRTKPYFVARDGRVVALRGLWSYAQDQPNNRSRKRRPAAAFNDECLFLSAGDLSALTLDKWADVQGNDAKYREPKESPRDYKIEWTPYSLYKNLAKKWTAAEGRDGRAVVVAGKSVFVGTKNGALKVFSAENGEKIGETQLGASPAWDGMAVAYGRIYVSTTAGKVLCFGAPGGEVPAPAPPNAPGETSNPTDVHSPSAPPPARRDDPTATQTTPAAQREPTAAPDASRWNAGLLKKTVAEVQTGRKPSFFLSAMKVKVDVLTVSPDGAMKLSGSGLSVPWQWSRLTREDLASLATNMAKAEDEESCRLAGYFLLAVGSRLKAEEWLSKMKDKDAAAAVRAAQP
jgi:outer membrane protein assembly factor BamB